jgi:hypothetical protein
MANVPSRRRPKAPASTPLTDAQRFAQAVRDHEEADRRARQAERERRAEQERKQREELEFAARLEAARAAHLRAVERVKEARRTGKGGAEADEAWKKAKAELVELETGRPPAWAKSAPDGNATEDDDPQPTQ